MVLTSLMSGNKLKMNRKPKGMRMIDIDEIVPVSYTHLFSHAKYNAISGLSVKSSNLVGIP